MSGVVSGLESYLVSKHGQQGTTELNTLASKHIVTFTADSEKKIRYCGCDIKDGVLRVLFAPEYLDMNTGTSMENIAKVLSETPNPSSNAQVLTYAARHSIKTNYEPKEQKIQKKLATLLNNPELKLNPNFEANFTHLKNATETASTFEKNLGRVTFDYFDKMYSTLEGLKFGSDDMLQEGLQEAMPKIEICVCVVNKLVKGIYNESIFENGVLYLQTTPANWWTNVGDAAAKIVDEL